MKLTLGEREFTVSTVDAGILEDFEADVKRFLALRDLPTGEDARAVVTLLHAVLTRRYADLSRDEVRKGVDMRNMKAVLGALAWAFGFEAKGDDAGEAGSPSSSTPPISIGA